MRALHSLGADRMEADLLAPTAEYRMRMPRFRETKALRPAGLDISGRKAYLAPIAASAWMAMRKAAKNDGVLLLLVSGFRSIKRQRDILEKKLKAGMSLPEILRVNALPGFSEHHTGRAIDLGSPDCPALTEEFENTKQFAWLVANAAQFGFDLSYPRENRHGIRYEPWHWCLK